jgi:hypothetical protein
MTWRALSSSPYCWEPFEELESSIAEYEYRIEFRTVGTQTVAGAFRSAGLNTSVTIYDWDVGGREIIENKHPLPYPSRPSFSRFPPCWDLHSSTFQLNTIILSGIGCIAWFQ